MRTGTIGDFIEDGVVPNPLQERPKLQTSRVKGQYPRDRFSVNIHWIMFHARPLFLLVECHSF